jgi:hypothetical protein
MIKAKPKIQLSRKTKPTPAEIDALFTAPSPEAQAAVDDLFLPENTPPPDVEEVTKHCPTCGTQRGKPAHPAHAVCKGCVQAPQRVRERLEVAVAVALRDQHNAARAAQEAYLALSDEERNRYDAYMSLRSRDESADTLTEKERRRLDATSAAYTNRADPRVSDALRTARHADECLYWVNAALQAKCKSRDVLLASLALCLEDLGRKDDADKLYR